MTLEIRRDCNQHGMRVLETGATIARTWAESVLDREAARSTVGVQAVSRQ
jgi:hypothetical protein